MALSDLYHPAFRTIATTGVGYLVLLIAMFVLLFVVPYAVFRFV